VPEDVKRRRNNTLLAVQNGICEEDNQAFLGREVCVLVEGPSKAAEKHETGGQQIQLTGRTNCDRIVVFEGNRRQIGQFLSIVIYDANAHTLFGEVVTHHAGPEVFGLSLQPVTAGEQIQ
jgi:tRNA-2-methylthio-N6-dimethylallyladenosine synthase